MSNRIITSRARSSSVQLVNCLSSLLVLELLKPGNEFVSHFTLVKQYPVD